jgi:diguanylate cyclase (GGDEF)-like protein/PAS domain S-box-containing protein
VHDEELRVIGKAGGIRHLIVHGRALHAEDGTLLGAVTVNQDITRLREQERALRASEERFRMAFDASPVGIALCSATGEFVQANDAMCRLVGRSADELHRLREADLTHPLEVRSNDLLRRLAGLGAGAVVRTDKRYVRADGVVVWVAASAVAVVGERGEPQVLLQAHDVSERQALQERLAYQALHDDLTGLPNRRLLIDRLTLALARSERSHRPVGVLLLDLDGFKAVNDSFGHGVGDEVLVAVAERLRSALRPSDTIARLGGDEFVVLCDDLPAAEDVHAVAGRLALALSVPIFTGSGPVHLGASIGAAVAEGPDVDADRLLDRADTAMYEVKRANRALLGR